MLMVLFSHCPGRRFNIGKIKGVDVIYVMTGEQTVSFLHLFYFFLFLKKNSIEAVISNLGWDDFL